MALLILERTASPQPPGVDKLHKPKIWGVESEISGPRPLLVVSNNKSSSGMAQQQEQEGGSLERVKHAGGCHCGAVRFEVLAPRDLDVYDCK